MKRSRIILFFFSLLLCMAVSQTQAQCSICTKTAQQLGEKPATGMNRGILYLAFMPMAIIGVIGYRWWKNEQSREA